MFGIIKGMAEVVLKTVTLPVAVAADVVTLGGMLTDKNNGTYTGDMITGIGESIEKIADE